MIELKCELRIIIKFYRSRTRIDRFFILSTKETSNGNKFCNTITDAHEYLRETDKAICTWFCANPEVRIAPAC